jgi:hypothetical protein
MGDSRFYNFQSGFVAILLYSCWIWETLALLRHRQGELSPRRRQQQNWHHHVARTVSSSRNLFTRPLNSKSPTTFRQHLPYEDLLGTNLPWTIDLPGDVNEKVQPSHSLTTPKLTIRLMEFNDIESIVTMNVQEYGSGPAYFPWSNLSLMETWIDRQYIRWLVDITCRIKLFNYLMEDDSSFTSSSSSSSRVQDHAILVGVLNDEKHTLVGMIEVSLQPLNPQITPSPIPIPIDIKRALAVMTTQTSQLVGWITNLLIVPQYRGYGYSKFLVTASEHMAKSHWNCTSIHLHCDADPITGMVPQKLYTQLGYRSPNLPSTTTRQTSGMDTLSPYIVEIEGVPLLYLRKDV